MPLPPAFRSPGYRAFWLGSIASVSGFQILRFGQFWLVFQLTGSPLALGYVGLANGVPAIFLNLFGGVAADKMDQRLLIMVSQTITAGLILLLAFLALFNQATMWHVLLIAFLAGAVEAFDQPARRSIFPHLVERQFMMSAVALNSSIWPGTRILAPAAAGFIIAWSETENPASAFFVAAAGFLVMVAVAWRLKVPRVTRTARGNPVQDIREGLAFIVERPIFAVLMALTFFGSFFGMAYITMMPIFAVDILGVGASGQGQLMGVGAIGSLVVALTLSLRTKLSGTGPLIVLGGVMGGLATIAFGLTAQYVGSFALAMALMLVMGVFNTMFTTLIQNSMQLMVPDAMRGRVMGFYGMTYNIRPLGGMQAGAMAALIGAPFALSIGGLAVAVFALVAGLSSRRLRNLDSLINLGSEGETNQTEPEQTATPTATGATDGGANG